MYLRYRDPNFWEAFRDRHWAPRVPTVFRQPFEAFPFTEAALLQAVKGFAQGLEAGDLRKHCLVSVGGKETAPRRPLKALFREPSASFDELEANIGRVFSKKPFGLMVTQMQAVDPGIWSPLAAFLQDGREWLGLPFPRAFLDLFYGNYASKFTGLHKDTQEIVAFVVRGEKRMLAWPFDYFVGKVKGLSSGHRYFNKRLEIDHRKYRKDAIVLDAKAGDVIYWPADHWHVAEPRGGFSAMVSLGLFRPETLGGRHPHADHLTSQDMTNVVAGADAPARLRWLTSYGFELGGPTSATAPPWTTVTKDPACVLLWASRPNGRLLVAANGHSLTLPDERAVRDVLAKLVRGETVPLPKLRRGLGPTRSAETGFNLACTLETRHRSRRRSSVDCLADWLLRVHAVSDRGSTR